VLFHSAFVRSGKEACRTFLKFHLESTGGVKSTMTIANKFDQVLASSWAGHHTRMVNGGAVAFTVTIMSCFDGLAIQAKVGQFTQCNE